MRCRTSAVLLASIWAASTMATARASVVEVLRTAHQAPASTLYWHAMARVVWARRFHVHETYHFVGPTGDLGGFDLRYATSHGGQTAWWLLQANPHYFEGPFRASIHTSRDDLMTIVSNMLLPTLALLHDGIRSHDFLRFQYGLQSIRFPKVTTRKQPHRRSVSTDVIAISARGYPWPCGPPFFCGPVMSEELIVRFYGFSARLTVDHASSVPISFDSVVLKDGHVYPGQHVTFSYR